MGLGIHSLKNDISLDSNPLKSIISVRILTLDGMCAVYGCIHTWTDTYIYIYIYIYICLYMYIYIYICIYIYIHIYMYYVSLSLSFYIYIYIYIHAHMFVSTELSSFVDLA